MPDFVARQRRIYRAQSAMYLARLGLDCSDTELASIDWPALESVPHWCFLPAAEQRALRLLCGAVFLAPQMHNWIEGQRIQSVRELIGAQAYTLVLRNTDPLADGRSIDEVSGDMANALEEAGTAVLLGAISQPVIRALVVGGTTGDPAVLGFSIATPLYRKALEISVQLRQQSQASNPATAASASGAGA